MQDLHFEIYIAAQPEAVWAALTEREGVAALFFGSRFESTFEAGSAYSYIGPDGKGNEMVHVEGTVVACKRNELLQLTHQAGAAWRTGPKVYRSRIAYAITALGYASKLAVTHDQWEEGDPGYAHNAEGWMLFLSSIKSYVETGKPLDLPM
jgi:uncharacterized protein YndB with AHSA1/START domain